MSLLTMAAKSTCDEQKWACRGVRALMIFIGRECAASKSQQSKLINGEINADRHFVAPWRNAAGVAGYHTRLGRSVAAGRH